MSSVQLQELEDHNFKQAELFGKLANIFPDLQDRQLDTTGIIKTLASGETITVERKHKDPFAMKPFAKLIFSANRMPQSRDLTHAFFRRFLIVPFVNRFEGKTCDPSMREKITTPEALSAFLNLAIEGLERLLSNHYVFTDTPSTRSALADYRQRTDSVRYFIDECCTVEPDGKVPRKALFTAYKEFCEEHVIPPMNARRFNEQVRENFPMVTPGYQTFLDGKRKKSWDGISVKEMPEE